MEPLLIDFGVLTSSSSPKARQQEFHKFQSALTSWGCFQLINHGIPRAFLDEMVEISRQFFTLPMEEKHKYGMLPGGMNGFRRGATVTSVPQGSDWNEVLSLTLYPEDRRELSFWPDKPPELKKMLHESTTKFAVIFDIIFKMVVHSLNVDELKLAERFGKNKEINAALNFYPQCPCPDDVLGLKSHSDFSALTIVLHDEAGLQVQNPKDGQWYMVPVVPGALFVHIDDTIEIMSNGILKSVVHRVVTNAEKPRVSVVLFWDSDRNSEIEPLDELITANRPQLYKKISHQDYISKFFDYYEAGQRAMDFVRI